MSDQLMNEKAAAEYLGLAVRTLQNWRWSGRGPAFVRVSGSCVRYRKDTIDQWLKAREVGSTSEATGS